MNPEWRESIQNLHAWCNCERRRGQPKREHRRERNQPIKNIPWECNRLLRRADGQIRCNWWSISPSKNQAIILMSGSTKTNHRRPTLKLHTVPGNRSKASLHIVNSNPRRSDIPNDPIVEAKTVW